MKTLMMTPRGWFRSVCWMALSLVCLAAPLATAQEQPLDGKWRWVAQKPATGWQQPDFDDAKWREGAGGFGTSDTPGARVGTFWSAPNIWMRKQFQLDKVPAKPALLVHHDEDVEVFINGKEVLRLTGYITEYKVVPIDDAAKSAIKAGKNVMAVHCRQTGGGQFVDVHLIDADRVPELPQPPRPTTPFKTALTTEWGEKVTADNAWREYPRPAFERAKWWCLNGSWDYAITPDKQTDVPKKWDGKIVVPFALESQLSGVQRLLDATEALWYHRSFKVEGGQAQRWLLNFEAVDYRSKVWVNGTLVGEHQGGNDPFTLDVTKAVQPGDNELIVRVEDATQGWQLNGKQSLMPRGIWYTQVSGIWQTVWLEAVSSRYLSDAKIKTDAGTGKITVQPIVMGAESRGEQVRVTVVGENGLTKTAAAGNAIEITVPNAKLWSPDQPNLYDLQVQLLDANGQVVDEVKTYAGIRTVGKQRDAEGNLRFTLNGQPIFHWGPLDQGWWPDGLLTPPSDAAMCSDIDFLKAAGFNMIRKHIKVEPRRYYAHCDRVGMLVWQDQVSGGKNPPWTRMRENPEDAVWPDREHEQYMHEFEEMVSSLESHPCIVVWTPFNEAWGQHRTVEVGKWIQARDPSRHVNIASGGNFWPVGDVADEHHYPHPDFPFNAQRYDADFIKVVGEFGGHGLPVDGHLWDNDRDNWGYGGLPKNAEEYKSRYLESIRLLKELKAKGISAGVYTQTTDVEGEINGLLTYDRRVQKIPAAELKRIHQEAGLR